MDQAHYAETHAYNIKVLFPDFVWMVCQNFRFWLFCIDLVAWQTDRNQETLEENHYCNFSTTIMFLNWLYIEPTLNFYTCLFLSDTL